MKPTTVSPRRVRVVASASAAGVALALGACSSSSSGSGGGSGSTGGGGAKIGVALITKDSSNPFFVAMQKGAKDLATKQGNIDLTIASGKQEGDDQGQITAIENAIAKGDKGILITPMSTGVNSAMKKARDAGLFVIALDTPPDPASTVDITFATDNFKAGTLIGTWAEAQMAGKPVTIPLLDLFSDKIVSVDYNRDQGFLTGMGIDTKDKKKNGDEDKTGKYKSGTYTIVCRPHLRHRRVGAHRSVRRRESERHRRRQPPEHHRCRHRRHEPLRWTRWRDRHPHRGADRPGVYGRAVAGGRGPAVPRPGRRHPRHRGRRHRPVDQEGEVVSTETRGSHDAVRDASTTAESSQGTREGGGDRAPVQGKGLIKTFGRVIGLDGVDIELYPGEVLRGHR